MRADSSHITLIGADDQPLPGLSPGVIQVNLNAIRAIFGKSGFPATINPYIAEPATLAVLVPAGLDLSRVKEISVEIDGAPVAISGALISAEQKAQNRRDNDAANPAKP